LRNLRRAPPPLLQPLLREAQIFEELKLFNVSPYTSPEKLAALDVMRAFVLANGPEGLIDQRALALADEPQAKISTAIEGLRREVADGLAQCDPTLPRSFIVGCAVAYGEMLRKRIREIEMNGKGWA
jgi:hypothetical protein